MKPQQTVVAAGGILFGLVLAQAVRDKSKSADVTYRQLWSVGLLTVGLALAADFAPQLVVPFAVAIVVAFTFRNPDVLGGLLRGAGVDTSGSSSSSAVARAGGGSVSTVAGGSTNARVGSGPGL